MFVGIEEYQRYEGEKSRKTKIERRVAHMKANKRVRRVSLSQFNSIFFILLHLKLASLSLMIVPFVFIISSFIDHEQHP